MVKLSFHFVWTVTYVWTVIFCSSCNFVRSVILGNCYLWSNCCLWSNCHFLFDQLLMFKLWLARTVMFELSFYLVQHGIYVGTVIFELLFIIELSFFALNCNVQTVIFFNCYLCWCHFILFKLLFMFELSYYFVRTISSCSNSFLVWIVMLFCLNCCLCSNCHFSLFKVIFLFKLSFLFELLFMIRHFILFEQALHKLSFYFLEAVVYFELSFFVWTVIYVQTVISFCSNCCFCWNCHFCLNYHFIYFELLYCIYYKNLKI